MVPLQILERQAGCTGAFPSVSAILLLVGAAMHCVHTCVWGCGGWVGTHIVHTYVYVSTILVTVCLYSTCSSVDSTYLFLQLCLLQFIRISTSVTSTKGSNTVLIWQPTWCLPTVTWIYPSMWSTPTTIPLSTTFMLLSTTMVAWGADTVSVVWTVCGACRCICVGRRALCAHIEYTAFFVMLCVDTAFCQNKDTEKWYSFDDSHVSETDPSHVMVCVAACNICWWIFNFSVVSYVSSSSAA